MFEQKQKKERRMLRICSHRTWMSRGISIATDVIFLQKIAFFDESDQFKLHIILPPTADAGKKRPRPRLIACVVIEIRLHST